MVYIFPADNDDAQEAEEEKDELKTPRAGRGGAVGEKDNGYFGAAIASDRHRLSKNDSKEHLLGGKSSTENSPAYSPEKKAVEKPSGLNHCRVKTSYFPFTSQLCPFVLRL